MSYSTCPHGGIHATTPIDGYTRVRAAEELGLLRVTAYEKTFSSDAEALAYAIHTQRDRRNLSDAELLMLIELVDQPQDGFRSALASFDANGDSPSKTAAITADKLGTSASKVERARVVLSDPDEAAAVRRGDREHPRGRRSCQGQAGDQVLCQTSTPVQNHNHDR